MPALYLKLLLGLPDVIWLAFHQMTGPFVTHNIIICIFSSATFALEPPKLTRKRSQHLSNLLSSSQTTKNTLRAFNLHSRTSPNFATPQVPQLSSSSCISVSDDLVVHSISFSSYSQWHLHYHGAGESSTGLPPTRTPSRLYQWAKAGITCLLLTKALWRPTSTTQTL